MKPLWAGALLLLGGCTAEGPVAQEIPERPTIVSLNPCTDAILAEVTAPGQLLAISHYSKDPQASSMEARQAARFRSTGGTVEEVLALDPDLVVAGSFIAPATRAALQAAGVRVATFGIADTVEDSETQVRELADLAGDGDAGERLVNRIEGALAATGPGRRRPVSALLWQPGGIVPGGQALVSELMRRTGFSSFSEARGLAQGDYVSLEEVVASPPEVLLVAGSEGGQRHPVLDRLPHMRRESFDPRLIYCGGPTIIRAVERLAQIRDEAA